MRLKNRKTGGKIVLSDLDDGGKTLWRFRTRVRFFERLIWIFHLHVSFLTFSLSDENIEIDARAINRVVGDMCQVVRRAGYKIFYLKVVEINPRRFLKYGKLVRHFHLVVMTNCKDAFPHAKKSDVSGRIVKVRDGKIITFDWLLKNAKQKLGIYFCCDAWSRNIYDYLGKYLSKPGLMDEFKKQHGKRVSVFSSSVLPIDFKMDSAQSTDYYKLLAGFPDAVDLYWRREGSRIVGRAKSVDEKYFEDGSSVVKISYPKILTIPSEWIVDRGGDLPPALEG